MSILSEEVIRTATDEYEKWKGSARLYATISRILRPLLIAATSVVAADKSLGQWKWFASVSDGWFFPILAVLAAIGTGIEAWLKPAEKWKGFLADRDVMDGLAILARSTDPNDTGALLKVLERVKEAQAKHVKDNVY